MSKTNQEQLFKIFLTNYIYKKFFGSPLTRSFYFFVSKNVRKVLLNMPKTIGTCYKNYRYKNLSKYWTKWIYQTCWQAVTFAPLLRPLCLLGILNSSISFNIVFWSLSPCCAVEMEMKGGIKGGHVATDILFSSFLIHYIFLKLRSLVTSIMMLHTFGLGPKPNRQR